MDKEQLKEYCDTYEQFSSVAAKLVSLAAERHKITEKTSDDVNLEQQIAELQYQIEQAGDAIFNAPASDKLSEATYDEGDWTHKRRLITESGPLEIGQHYETDPAKNLSAKYWYSIRFDGTWPPSPNGEFDNAHELTYIATSTPYIGAATSTVCVDFRDALRAELQTFHVICSDLGVNIPSIPRG